MVEIGKRRNVSKDTRKRGYLKTESSGNREKEGGEKRKKARGIG